MSYRLPLWLFFVWLLTVQFTPLCLAQDIGLPLDPAAESVPKLPPDPRKLTGAWWQYFEHNGELKTSNIAAARTRLGELVTQAGQPDAIAALEQFNASLQLLGELKTAAAPAAESDPVIAETYTLAELIELEKRRLELEAAVELERGDTDRQETSALAARRALDARFATYLSRSETAKGRLSSGLGIMADRATAAVAELRAQRSRATLQVREKSLQAAAEAVALARGRLQANPEALVELQTQIAAAQASLAKAGVALRAAEDRHMPIAEDSPVARATARLHQQQVIHAAAVHSQAQADLFRLEAQRDWVSLRTVTMESVDTQVLSRHESRTAFINTVVRERREWQAATQRELLNMTVVENESVEVSRLTSERLKVAQNTLVALDRLRRSVDEMRLVADLVDAEVAGREGLFARGFSTGLSGLRAAWHGAGDLFGRSLFRIGDTPVTTLGLMRLLLILLVALWVSRLFRAALARFASTRATQNQAAFYTIARLAHYLIIVVGLVVGLSSIGLNLSNLALVAGALSVGIGFGLQSIVNNFVSGLIILFERSLKVGDFIELGSGLQGTVKEINVRSTLINTNDNIDIVVPNSEFVSSRLTNWTLRDADRRVHIPFGVAYGTDKELVRKVVLVAAERVAYTLTAPKAKAPQVWLVGFGDSSLNFELIIWLRPDAVRRPSMVNAEYTWEIETALTQAEIEIPFPQRDLHLRSGFPVTDKDQHESADAT